MTRPGTLIVSTTGPRMEFFIKRAATGKTEHHIIYMHDEGGDIEVEHLEEGDEIFHILP